MQRVRYLPPAFVFALVVILYYPTLRGGFVYDSIAQVLYSDYIHAASNWGDVVTLRVAGQDELDRNRPLHLASLMLDAAIWKKEPFGYRLTSVLLHALNAALLFAFISMSFSRSEWTGRDERPARPPPIERARGPHAPTMMIAAFGALVFALHPLVVEAVAEPSNREDLLVLLPLLVGLLGIVAPVRLAWVLNGVFVLCSFFAVLAKESGAAVPLVFAVACWIFRRGDFRSLIPGLAGGLFSSLAFLAASYVWRPEASAILAQSPSPLAADFWSLLSVQGRIWTLQLWQILWPWNLSAHYPPQVIAGIFVPVALIVLASAAALALWLARGNRLAGLGLAIYILALLPASNFAAQFHPIADRYLYVPLAGVGLLAAALVQRLRIQYSSRSAGGLLVAAGFVLLSAEYAANVRRQIIWQQPTTLWVDVLRQFPRTAQAHLGMANVHYRAGDYHAARAAAAEAVMIDGGRWADALAMRAICEWQTGDRAAARESFGQARRLSCVYQNNQTMLLAVVWSPEQLAVLAEIARET